jgi:CBS domain-containing protein
MSPTPDQRMPCPRQHQQDQFCLARPPGNSRSRGVLTASEVMTSPVTTVKPDTSILEAAAMLARNGVSALPVLDDDGAVVGIATEADLARDQLCASRQRTGTSRERIPTTVGEVMSRTPLIAPPDYELAELVSLMLVAGTSVVPIVDNCRLVGIISMREVLRIVGSGHPDPRSMPAPSDSSSVGHAEYQGLAMA